MPEDGACPKPKRWVTLHDAGGALLLTLVGGSLVGGFIFDFVWNYLVLRFTL